MRVRLDVPLNETNLTNVPETWNAVIFNRFHVNWSFCRKLEQKPMECVQLIIIISGDMPCITLHGQLSQFC